MAEKRTSPPPDDLRGAGGGSSAGRPGEVARVDVDDDVVVGRRSSYAVRADAAAPMHPIDAEAVDLDGADDDGGGGEVQPQFWMTDVATTVVTAVMDELSSRAGPDGFVGRAVDEAVDLVLGEDGNNDNGSGSSTDDGGEGDEAGGGEDDGGGDGASGQSFGRRAGRFVDARPGDDEPAWRSVGASAFGDGADDARGAFEAGSPDFEDAGFDDAIDS